MDYAACIVSAVLFFALIAIGVLRFLSQIVDQLNRIAEQQEGRTVVQMHGTRGEQKNNG